MTNRFLKATQSNTNPFEFVASTESADRSGDIVVQEGWKLDAFKSNPIALWQHDSRMPIGTWENVRVEGKSLMATLKLAAKGTSEFIDTVRKLIEQRIVKAVSVGFRPLDISPIRDAKGNPTGGYLIRSAELFEISVVSIPANSEALSLAKSLGQGDRERLFAKTGANPQDTRNTTVTTLAMRIKAAQDELNTQRDTLTSLTASETIDTDETQTAIDSTSGSIEALEKSLATLKRAEATLARNTTKSADTQTVPGSAIRRAPPADAFFKAGFATFCSILQRRSVEDVIKNLYGSEARDIEVMAKAATAAATTQAAGWAAELVREQVGEFATLLVPMSIWAAFPGLSFAFGSDGKITIPGRDYSKTVSGGFIGEGGAIPVKAGGTRAVSLTPDKVAVIIALTRELARRSSPAALPLFQQMVLEDTSMTLDTLFLDNSPAVPNIRPGGMQTLATGPNTRVSSGAAYANILADVKSMVTQMQANRMGRRPVWIMSEANRMSLGLITNDLGQFMFSAELGRGTFLGYPFLSSTNVPGDVVFLIDANEIVKAQEGAPMFDVSEQATVHMDTAPNADIGSVATGLVSFYQTDQMGLRMIWELTWAARQAGPVQTLTGVAW